MRGREKFAKYKPIIIALTKMYSLMPRSIRNKKMARLRKRIGGIAFLQRYCLLKSLAKSVGDNVAIYPDVYLMNIQEMEIGTNVSFQPLVYIEAYGGVKIGDDVSFAEGASMFSVNHGTDDADIPIKYQTLKSLPIEIKDNVWIGSKATILGGVTINSGCVVAAGAVVNKSFPENVVVGGVPAKILKERQVK